MRIYLGVNPYVNTNVGGIGKTFLRKVLQDTITSLFNAVINTTNALC